jgi:hypothetical protein
MPGFDNGVVFAENVDFSGGAAVSETITTDGQLIIGTTVPNLGGTHISIGTISSPLGTLQVGYQYPDITLDITSGASGTTSFATDSGGPAVPDGLGQISILGATNSAGGVPVETDGSVANTVYVRVQVSSAQGSSSIGNSGLASFNSNYFSVDANGFVSAVGAATFTWVEVTGTSQAAAVNTGYILNNAGLVTLTLPSTAAVGQIVEAAGKGSGGWRIAQNAGQTIHFGSANTTTGAGGRLDSTNRYDCVRLLCTTANTDFTVLSSVGNISVT